MPNSQGEIAGRRSRRADFSRRNAGLRHEAAVVHVTERRVVGVVAHRGARRRPDPLAQRIPRTLIDFLHRIDLRRAETGRCFCTAALQGLPGVREHEGGGVEVRPACRDIVDDAIDAPVKGVAGRNNGTGEQLLIGRWKCRIKHRTAVGQLLHRRRRDGLDRLDAPNLAERDRLLIVDRVLLI
jgi:hypothetical protein